MTKSEETARNGLTCTYRGCPDPALHVGPDGHVRHQQPPPQGRPRHSPRWRTASGREVLDVTEVLERAAAAREVATRKL